MRPDENINALNQSGTVSTIVRVLINITTPQWSVDQCKYLIQMHLHFLCQDEIICISECDVCLFIVCSNISFTQPG